VRERGGGGGGGGGKEGGGGGEGKGGGGGQGGVGRRMRDEWRAPYYRQKNRRGNRTGSIPANP